MKSEEIFNRLLAQIEQNSSGKTVSYIVNAGDMNHGKSSLFNSLIGHEEFKVRDVRETVVNKEYPYTDDIVFIDTPGLCATDDDNAIAFEAYKKASCIIFVHNVKAGMLHKNELQEINQISNLFNDKKFFWKHFCLVFTFKEAIENNEDVETIVNDSIKSIHAECNAMPFSVFSVSNSRFQKGIAQGKKGLIKHSGILELKEFIDSSLKNIRSDEKQLRRNRMTQLCDDAISRLQGRRREIDLAISKKRQNTNREIEEKRRNVLAVLDGYVNSSTELRDVQKKVERIQQEVDRLRAKHKAEKILSRVEGKEKGSNMFVAVVGVAVVGGALAHDRYSRYGDHSQYSDHSLLMEIKEKEAELSKRKKEAEIANRQFIERGNELKEILQENGLSVNSLDERDVEAELTKLEKELEAAIAEDVRELEYIDKAIRKLNDIKNQKTNP